MNTEKALQNLYDNEQQRKVSDQKTYDDHPSLCEYLD